MISYELAKKLKDAGFPQPDKSEFYEGKFSCGCNEGKDIEGKERKEVLSCGREYMYYPTLSELIEACGDGLHTLHRIETMNLYEEWEAQGYQYSKGSIPSEAVANLWLELKTK